MLFALKEWDEARDTALRCLSINPNCIQALSLEITFLLARSGAYQDVRSHAQCCRRLIVLQAASKIGNLISVLDRVEPCSHPLYAQLAVAPARLRSDMLVWAVPA